MAHGKSCENCAAWEPSIPARLVGRHGDRTGLCRMRSPQSGVWPTTKGNDWCCDFRPGTNGVKPRETNGATGKNGGDR